MKAILLAAGKGERLKDLTKNCPKPMILVNGRPIIEHNIEMCKSFGITDILINVHYMPEKISNYLGDGRKLGVQIVYKYEPDILGTAGAVRNFAKHLSAERFFVIYADNLSNYDLNKMYKQHLNLNADMSMALFYLEDVSQSGVAVLGNNDVIQNFIEKPNAKATQSHWVNAGIYILEPELISDIPLGFSDFGKDIIPRFIANNKKVVGVRMKQKVIAIDTPKLYRQAIKNSNELM